MNGGVVCWSCRGVTGPGLFCRTCDAIQPVDPAVDFFRLFGVEPAFGVDAAALEGRYRELQRVLHPDFFAGRSSVERRLSLEHATRLNEAWQTLTDPLARGGYLLTLLGWRKSDAVAPDPGFLHEVMALRETLEELDTGAPDALSRIERMRSDARERMRHEEEQMNRLFAAHAAGSGPEALARIAPLLDRMRYHRRYLEELDRLEDQVFESESSPETAT